MESVEFYVDINYQQFTALYTGAVDQVIVRSRDGRRIQLPASRLKPFVTHSGVKGWFCLRFDHNRKFAGLERIE